MLRDCESKERKESASLAQLWSAHEARALRYTSPLVRYSDRQRFVPHRPTIGLAGCLLVLSFGTIWRVLESPTRSRILSAGFICLLFAQCVYSESEAFSAPGPVNHFDATSYSGSVTRRTSRMTCNTEHKPQICLQRVSD
jgi:hypothetical protein